MENNETFMEKSKSDKKIILKKNKKKILNENKK